MRYSGSISLSADAQQLAVTNLYDGIDWYSLQQAAYGHTSWTRHTLQAVGRHNVIIPIVHIGDSKTVVIGSSGGTVRIINSRDGRTLHTLDHARE